MGSHKEASVRAASPFTRSFDPSFRKSVTFRAESPVRHIENSLGEKTHKSPNMAKQVFERFDGHELTDKMLEDAATLFNENYGIWGEDPANPMYNPKPGMLVRSALNSSANMTVGSRVKLSKTRLRAEYLPDNASCSYVRVAVDDRLAGNAFACRWSYQDKIVCWVTQLVVHNDFRERGLAVGLLNQLRLDNDSVYGLMSSHPAACLAAAKAFGSRSNTTPFETYMLTFDRWYQHGGHQLYSR